MTRFEKPFFSIDQASLRSLGGLVFLTIFFFAGCSDTTEPIIGPQDLSFTHSPESAVIEVFQGEGAYFSVSSSPVVDLDYAWWLNGDQMGNGPVYQFEGTQVGIDTLKCVISYSSTEWNHVWYVKVGQDPSTAPGRVPGVQLAHGPEAGDVVMTWFWISGSRYPLVEYQFAVSFDGPITAQNWAEATPLGSVPHVEGQVGYSTTFTIAKNAILAGRDGWFGIRGVDEVGQMSPLNEFQQHQVSFPWWIEGKIYSDRLVPLEGVIIDYGCPSCRVNTDGTGFYSIGPLSSVNSYDLRTISRDQEFPGVPFSAWYDFHVREVRYNPDASNDITLVTRYDMNGFCEVYDEEFLEYFRHMTFTNHPTALRPNKKLYKWEEYPVSVYIPPFTGFYGEYDYQALCREAVGYWNLAMGEDYLYLVDSPEEAQIVFLFDNENHIYDGSTDLVLPDDENYSLGETVPEKMTIYITGMLVNSIRVQEICMHELGHALGLVSHNYCGGGQFMMSIDPGGILDNGPENAIHPFEKDAIRVIRNLPQGVDMESFDVD
jgi:hypothetical protein